MKKRDFYFFVVPSLLMMFLFIAVPLAIVFKQSFYITQNVFEKVEVETCTPGFLKQICETKIETKPKLDENGNVIEVSVFVGFENYKNLLQINKFKPINPVAPSIRTFLFFIIIICNLNN